MKNRLFINKIQWSIIFKVAHRLWIAESKNDGKNISTRSQEPVSRVMDVQIYNTITSFPSETRVNRGN